MKEPKKRYDDQLAVGMPRDLSELVATAAQQQYIPVSAYIRQAIATKLKSDGFSLAEAS
jgi:predicted HicB family RNase H-like nuclease